MTTATFGSDDVRLGEAIYRSEGHCSACYELYIGGRPADAALQAARPIADVLPWLETELRSARAGLRSFTVAVAHIGAEARGGAKPRAMRRALRRVADARAALLQEAIGAGATTDAFRASVAIALLQTVREVYGDAVRSESLNGYQSAYGVARKAIELLAPAVADSDAEQDLTIVRASFPSVEPQEELWRPDAIDEAIDKLQAFAADHLGALSAEPTLEDSLEKVARLLEDVEASYGEDQPALAARLAASLFVRTFDPVRAALAARDPRPAELLTDLLGVSLRRAINDGASRKEVRALVEEARSIIAGVPSAPVSNPE